jgi:FAD/FMN-containing dehydrogenase
LRQLLEDILAWGVERSLVSDAAIAESLEQTKVFWRIRENFGEAQRHDGGSIKHDISVPVAAVPAFLKEAHAAVLRGVPGARSLPFGHLGDGNIHYNVNQPIGADKAEYLTHWNDMNAAVYEVVKQYGGSISAEHGIGVVKRHQLASVKDPVALDLMRSLKNLLDPKGILNSGKVL